MDHTDRLTAVATIQSLDELMHVWAVIEYELVRQSRFFSLIDIYGHYANRGDTVVVETEVDDALGSLAKVVSYFGRSAHCGMALSLKSASTAMQTPVSLMPERVDELRALRWDVRTKATHPTLPAEYVLCTYPFPALSAKAHFEKGLAADSYVEVLAGEGLAG
jgi:DNA (cytosine-5)-methyltransferase 1